MNAYEVFAYWNGQDIFNALNAVAAIMGGGDYLGLMKAVGIVGLLAAISFALLSQRGSAAGSYFMGFVFIYSVMFVPKANVTVNDLRAGTTYVVANVPLGLAAPYATISRIGNFLTQQYEARFTALDDERFSKSGMVFGARVLETMAIQGFPDPTLKSDVMTFYKDCIVPELIEDGTKAKLLKNSKDIAVTMQSIVNPGRGTVMGSVTYAGSSAMSCANVLPAISTYLTTTNVAQESLEKVGRTVHGDQGVSASSAVLIATTETDVTNMLTNLMAISDSAQQALAQSMWINGIHDADMALRNGYGNAQSTSYATAVTEQSSRQAAYTGKLWAEKALPLIRNIAEFVLISSFPLVFIIMLVAGENALKVVKLYLTILTSLALWAPFTAILNSLVINNGKQAILAMKASGGGITLENVNGLIDLALQQQSLAGQLFLAVPMVAYALVSAGAQAATAAVGGLTSSATGAAGQIAGQVSQGNVGGGQVGWRNVNAFNTSTGQSNTAMSSKAGFAQIESGAGTLVLGGGAPGGGTFSARDSSAGPYEASSNKLLQNAAQQSMTANATSSRSSVASALDSIKSAMVSGYKNDSMQKAEASLKSADAAGNSQDKAKHLDNAAQYAYKAAHEASADRTNQRQWGLSLGGNSGGAGGSAGASLTNRDGTKFGEGNAATTTEGYGKKSTDVDGVSQKDEAGTSAVNSNSNGSYAQSALEKAKQFSQQGSAQAQQSMQASEVLSATSTDSGGMGKKLTQEIFGRMGGATAAAALYANDQKGFEQSFMGHAQQIMTEKGLGPGELSQLKGGAGGAPISGSALTSAMQTQQNAVAGQTAGAPVAANTSAADLQAGSAGTAGTAGSAGTPGASSTGGKNRGGGSPLATPDASKNPFGTGVKQPQTPTSVARPDGSTLTSSGLQAKTKDSRAKTRNEVTSGGDAVQKKVDEERGTALKGLDNGKGRWF